LDVADALSVSAAGRAPAASVPQRSFAHGMTLFAVYGALYLATLAGALAPFPVSLSLAFAIANGVFIAMVFILGHDCCHGALVPGSRWNAWLGRIAFLPVLHSASLWRLAHNQRHHGRTNLKGFDPVWTPMALSEYRAASPARRWRERLYRGFFGPLVYYHVAVWLPMLLLPVGRQARAQWRRHVADSLFVFAGGAALIAAILFAGHALAPARALWLVAVLGWAVPFAMWSYLAAVTTYLNHTHPDIPWFDGEDAWRAANGNLRGTAHVKMPVDFLPLYSDVMAHTAHHVNPSSPVYALPAEQALLKARFGEQIHDYMLSVDAYRRIVKACKLFDFERMCWVDFDGTPTGPAFAAD
jgi:omega-6 fatty acid desaturase (delta-12 desaturase)